jgi:hypothetical protein
MTGMGRGRKIAVARQQDRPRRRKGGRMRIVTVDAVVAEARSPAKVPVAAHSAVRSTVVFFALRAMTLRAQGQRVGHRYRPAIREPELVVTAGLMARAAAQVTVGQGQAAMKLAQLVRLRR